MSCYDLRGLLGVPGGSYSSVARGARIWLGFEPDRTSQAVSGSARQVFRCQANYSARPLTGFI